MDICWGKGKNETREPGVVRGENNGDIDDAGDSGEGQKRKSEEPLSSRVRRSLGLPGHGRRRRRSKPRRILAWMDRAVC